MERAGSPEHVSAGKREPGKETGRRTLDDHNGATHGRMQRTIILEDTRGLERERESRVGSKQTAVKFSCNGPINRLAGPMCHRVRNRTDVGPADFIAGKNYGRGQTVAIAVAKLERIDINEATARRGGVGRRTKRQGQGQNRRKGGSQANMGQTDSCQRTQPQGGPRCAHR